MNKPAPTHDNGFGAMRLAFAILVLVSHAPELLDGNSSREILTQVFGTMSFGELAVDAFFVISGALITASWQASLWRRVVRIYLGFLGFLRWPLTDHVPEHLCGGPVGLALIPSASLASDCSANGATRWPWTLWPGLSRP